MKEIRINKGSVFIGPTGDFLKKVPEDGLVNISDVPRATLTLTESLTSEQKQRNVLRRQVDVAIAVKTDDAIRLKTNSLDLLTDNQVQEIVNEIKSVVGFNFGFTIEANAVREVIENMVMATVIPKHVMQTDALSFISNRGTSIRPNLCLQLYVNDGWYLEGYRVEPETQTALESDVLIIIGKSKYYCKWVNVLNKLLVRLKWNNPNLRHDFIRPHEMMNPDLIGTIIYKSLVHNFPDLITHTTAIVKLRKALIADTIDLHPGAKEVIDYIDPIWRAWEKDYFNRFYDI